MKLLISILFSAAIFAGFAQDLYSFEENEKHGYIDANGKIIIKAKYDAARQFSEELAVVYLDSVPVIINKKGKVKFVPPFDQVDRFVEGYAMVIRDEKYGMIDATGAVVVPPIYDRISRRAEGKIGLKVNDLWSFFSLETKQFLNDQKYAEIGPFSENRAMVQDQFTGKSGFINEKGVLVIPMTLDHVYSPFSNGFAPVRDGNKASFYINKDGMNQFGKNYDGVKAFHEGRAFVTETFGAPGYFIDTLGNRTSAHTYESAWWFSEGFCGVSNDSMFMIIDKDEHVVFSSETIELRFYVDGFGAFCDHSGANLTWGIMNTDQEIISDRRFTLLVNKTNNLLWEFYAGDPAKWYESGKRGYINLKGEVIWEEL